MRSITEVRGDLKFTQYLAHKESGLNQSPRLVHHYGSSFSNTMHCFFLSHKVWVSW